jgi:hypothetical protein
MPGIVRQVLRDAVACTCPARVCLVPGGGAGNSAGRHERTHLRLSRNSITRSAGVAGDSASFGILCQCHLIPPQAPAPGTNVPPCTGPPARDSPASAVAGDRRLPGATLALAYAQELPERERRQKV